MIAEAGGHRPLEGNRADFLADPAVDRRRRDRIAHMPVGAFVLEADRRPHQAHAARKCCLGAAHRAEREIGLAEARFGALAALDRRDDRPGQRPGELRLPNEARIAELGSDAKLAVAARAELAEAPFDPALLAVDRDEADIAGDFDRVGSEEPEIGLGVRRRRAQRHERASHGSRAAAKQAFGDIGHARRINRTGLKYCSAYECAFGPVRGTGRNARWSGREDSNLRPLPPEDSALPG